MVVMKFLISTGLIEFGKRLLKSSLSSISRAEVTQRNIRTNAPIAVITSCKSASQNHTKLGSGLNSVQILGDLTEPFVPENSWKKIKFRGS